MEEDTADVDGKICGVCGDRALGYNFKAVSCESCKAFFRRNALKNKMYRCPFSDNCNINPVTRRFCQKCRLDKCFEIGMKKEYIMSDEDKVIKKQKIENNKAKKRPHADNEKQRSCKKNSTDEFNFDESSTSIPSVASVSSESYLWESDKKYKELNSARSASENEIKCAMGSVSPATAASVPSPSSPPESCNIVSSKTLDMLKDAAHSPLTAFSSIDNSRSYVSNNLMDNTCAQGSYSANSIRDFEQGGSNEVQTMYLNEVIVSFSETERITSNLTSTAPSSSKIQKFDSNLPTYTTLKPLSEEQKVYPQYGESSINCKLEYCSHDPTPTTIRTKELGSKRPNWTLKNGLLINKIASNPNVINELLLNPVVISKLLSDPEIINKLTSDPEISQLFEENISIQASEKTDITCDVGSKKEFINQQVSDPIDRKSANNNQNPVQNPILTNLITNKNSKSPQNQTTDAMLPYEETTFTDDIAKDVLENVERLSTAANSIDSILSEAIKLEYSACSLLGGSQSTRDLNDAERAKLNELIVANKALLAPLEEDISNLIGDENIFKCKNHEADPVLLDVINLTAIAIRRLIKMAKKISAFKNMCQEDQLALLKGGCTEMMILRSAHNYDPDKESWNIPLSREIMSKIKVDVLKEAKGNLYSEHTRFVRTFDPRWRDENIILILCAITLFSPERPRVIHTDVIKLEQNSYYYLLRRYLESIYPGCEAKSMFLRLIQKISELHKHNEEFVGVYLNVNPSSVEPLLIEIFDLKH